MTTTTVPTRLVSPRAAGTLTVLVAAAATAVATVAASLAPSPYGAGTALAVLCFLVLVQWPWATLPLAIIGGTVGAVALGQADVTTVIAMHVALLGLGLGALAARRAVGWTDDVEVVRIPIAGMLAIAGLAIAGALYGSARDNLTSDIVVAGYHLSVIPMHYFAARWTLDSADRRRKAAWAFVLPVALLTALAFFTPGRHGGLLPLLALPVLVETAGRLTGWRRAAVAATGAVMLADVALGSYRSVWIAAVVTLAAMFLRGGPLIRRGLVAVGVAVGAGVAIFVLALTLSSGLDNRIDVVSEALDRDGGYRSNESAIGWDVFERDPIFGAGVGQTTPDVYVPGFTVTDVGPIYHSFYIVLLANVGLVGLLLVLGPVARSIWVGTRPGASGIAASSAALTLGLAVAASATGPTDGHWELGLLPALTFLTLRSPEAER